MYTSAGKKAMSKGRLKSVGFFRELRHGLPNGPSIRDAIRAEASKDDADLIRYLDAGALMIVSGVNTYDVFAEHKTCIQQLFIATDGVWMWPSDLSYYVAKYHVALPDEFVELARQRQWQPPPFAEGETGAVWERHQKAKNTDETPIPRRVG